MQEEIVENYEPPLQDNPFGDDMGGGLNDDIMGADNDGLFADQGFGLNDDIDFDNGMQDDPAFHDMEDNNIPEESDYDFKQLRMEGEILRQRQAEEQAQQ